jgi:hypothetical protein
MSRDPEFAVALLDMREAVLIRKLSEVGGLLLHGPEDELDEHAQRSIDLAEELAAVRRQRDELVQAVIVEAQAITHHTRHCWHDIGAAEPACCWCGLFPSEAGMDQPDPAEVRAA